MPLIVDTLGTAGDKVKTLEKEILVACGKARDTLSANSAGPVARRWFGDDSAAFLKELKTKVVGLRAFLNLNPISCGSAALTDKNASENAAAFKPAGGWDDYRNLGKAHGSTFQMHVNLNFAHLKSYAEPNPATCDGQSQFETLVHELSHLVLNTNDETLTNGDTAYGGDNARELAKQAPDKAKTNAENWGFFIEEFR